MIKISSIVIIIIILISPCMVFSDTGSEDKSKIYLSISSDECFIITLMISPKYKDYHSWKLFINGTTKKELVAEGKIENTGKIYTANTTVKAYSTFIILAIYDSNSKIIDHQVAEYKENKKWIDIILNHSGVVVGALLGLLVSFATSFGIDKMKSNNYEKKERKRALSTIELAAEQIISNMDTYPFQYELPPFFYNPNIDISLFNKEDRNELVGIINQIRKMYTLLKSGTETPNARIRIEEFIQKTNSIRKNYKL